MCSAICKRKCLGFRLLPPLRAHRKGASVQLSAHFAIVVSEQVLQGPVAEER